MSWNLNTSLKRLVAFLFEYKTNSVYGEDRRDYRHRDYIRKY